MPKENSVEIAQMQTGFLELLVGTVDKENNINYLCVLIYKHG